jgi:hypothetical protein
VGGVPLDGLDEVRDEVVTTVQLDVDLAPRLLHQVPQPDEAVVRGDGPEHGDHDNDAKDDQDDDTGGHGWASQRSGRSDDRSVGIGVVC